MKCYAKNKDEKQVWVKKVFQHGDQYEIIFADGTRFFADVNEENFDKLMEELEIQADKAVEALPRLVAKKTLTGIMIPTVFTAIPAACFGVATIPAVQDLVYSQEPMKVLIGIGAITVLGTIPVCAKFIKEKGMVKEARKLKYRFENREYLDEIEDKADYPNALVGLSSRAKRHFETQENPMSIFYIDEYSEEDLRKIVSNVRREEHLGLSYDEPVQKVKK
ncbi:MAG: hypothetical protein IJI22_04210 [Bacilli bacterium]|nr:hypothetical protein [Bacilli bacterium]